MVGSQVGGGFQVAEAEIQHPVSLIEADAPISMQKRPEAANLVALTES